METQNPWWYGEEDATYMEWLQKDFKWIPPILRDFNFKPFSLNFLVGPRQVGKTTTLKIFIHKKLLPKTDPYAVFYFSCEELTNFRELGEILDNYLNFRDSHNIKTSYIILDEITFVEGWHRALKIRIDNRRLRKDVIIVSGSASLELLKQKEYFPGRRGGGKDLIFYPLDFGNYVKVLGKLSPEICEIENVEKCMNINKIHKTVLGRLFKEYLITGGFPLPIIEFHKRGKISYQTKKVYIDWIKNDIRKIGKNETYMKEVISYIIRSRCSPVSWLSISKETSLASPHTTQSYVEDLKTMFITEVFYLLQPDGHVKCRKNKKIYITDPFLYQVLGEWVRETVNEDQILESLVVCTLARKYDTYYWRNGSEVDAVIPIDDRQIGIEVKTIAKSWRKPKHLSKVIYLTRSDIPLFLASLRIQGG
ncbi:ATPase [Candidatus Bathyarchaeota archaeon ex4484_205]|nr:MAG: ATPase [Candidatus Bathyarchaeota archaeon ex4484_205]